MKKKSTILIDCSSHPIRGGYRTRLGDNDNSKEGYNPLITIITVVYNGAKTIERAINSVINQTYKNIEYIVIDGGSTDGTIDILRRFDNSISYWISEPDLGIYNALNKGISLARGSHYIPLGSDDILLPNAVDQFIPSMKNSLITRARAWHDPLMADITKIKHAHSTGVLININAHKLYGLYDESYKIAADTKFLEIAKKNGQVKDIDAIVGVFFPGGASGNYSNTIKEHARAMVEAGAWSKIKVWGWLLPRKILAVIRSQ